MSAKQNIQTYRDFLSRGLDGLEADSQWPKICDLLVDARAKGSGVFMAGNGGSAANANHLATDLIYGVNAKGQGTLRVHSLASNPSVMTCLGNDTGYENIFANQLEALAQPKDLLLVFSGSGNSPNILKLLEVARRLKVSTISFLGFDGGKAKPLSDYPLHFPIYDMQAVEDLHMIAAHLLMKNLLDRSS